MNKKDRFENDSQKYIEEVRHNNVHIMPYKEAFYITVWYVILGSLWILFSDTILNMFVKNYEVVQRIQLIKGWVYVVITGIYIYVLIYYRMKLLKTATDEMHENYLNMSFMNEEIIKKENEIFELSHYDPMTGLLNWVGLSSEYEKFTNKNSEKNIALFYIDIDNIKHVNDTLGHENGNLLLNKIAVKLSRLQQNDELICRVSGDEFIVVKSYDGDDIDLHKMASKMNEMIKTTWKFDRYEFFITASIGVSSYPRHGKTLDALIKQADSAMFIAKDNGKNQHYIYNEIISKRTQNYVEVISQIRHGITKNEFELYYQPIVEMGTGTLIGVEALIRWHHPKRGFLTPYHFIDIAEESGQISEIGKWVFRTACEQLHLWHEKAFPAIKMSVNVSGKRLFDKNLVEDMSNVIALYGIDSKYLQVEITETSVMENLKLAIEILNNIRELGISIALDDFGTGYSSLTYLQMFPIDVLKIDKEFIKNISIKGMEKENSIINAVISLAHSLELDIVAEGVETNDQAEYLLINGCDFGQGYYYDKPMPIEALEEKYFKQ